MQGQVKLAPVSRFHHNIQDITYWFIKQLNGKVTKGSTVQHTEMTKMANSDASTLIGLPFVTAAISWSDSNWSSDEIVKRQFCSSTAELISLSLASSLEFLWFEKKPDQTILGKQTNPANMITLHWVIGFLNTVDHRCTIKCMHSSKNLPLNFRNRDFL